jgi:hypothetical protein
LTLTFERMFSVPLSSSFTPGELLYLRSRLHRLPTTSSARTTPRRKTVPAYPKASVPNCSLPTSPRSTRKSLLPGLSNSNPPKVFVSHVSEVNQEVITSQPPLTQAPADIRIHVRGRKYSHAFRARPHLLPQAPADRRIHFRGKRFCYISRQVFGTQESSSIHLPLGPRLEGPPRRARASTVLIRPRANLQMQPGRHGYAHLPVLPPARHQEVFQQLQATHFSYLPHYETPLCRPETVVVKAGSGDPSQGYRGSHRPVQRFRARVLRYPHRLLASSHHGHPLRADIGAGGVPSGKKSKSKTTVTSE